MQRVVDLRSTTAGQSGLGRRAFKPDPLPLLLPLHSRLCTSGLSVVLLQVSEPRDFPVFILFDGAYNLYFALQSNLCAAGVCVAGWCVTGVCVAGVFAPVSGGESSLPPPLSALVCMLVANANLITGETP